MAIDSNGPIQPSQSSQPRQEQSDNKYLGIDSNWILVGVGLILLALVAYYIYNNYITKSPPPSSGGPAITANPTTINYTTDPLLGPTFTPDSISIAGTGFTPSSPVLLTGGTGNSISIVNSSVNGSISYQITLPQNIGSGGESTVASNYGQIVATDESTMKNTTPVKINFIAT